MAHVTVPDEPTRVQFTVTTPASAGPFAFAFSYFGTDDVEVYDGTDLVDPNDYTLTPTASVTGGYEGGSITLDVAVSNTTITVLRNVPIERETDFPTSGPFPINTLNSWIDKIYAILQQIATKLTRTVRVADTDTSASLVLPAAATRASKVLAFDANGAVTVSTETLSDIEGAATSATAAAASATAAAASATTASTQAGIATTQASNAAASATAAAASAASGLFSVISDKSADFTIVADTDNTTLFKIDTSGGNVIATLPAISSAGEGERYGFLRTSASNTLTLARNGSDTINGVAGNYTVSTTVGNIILIVADDATPDNWIVIVWALVQADGTSLSQSGNTLSLNLANRNTFTAPQRSTPVTDNDGSFDLNAGQDFLCTPTGAVALTFTNKPSGQKGTIRFTNGSNYAVTRAANVLADSDFNALVSATGTYIISYWSYDGTNVAVVATKALT